MRGSHENGDVFFQHREACNTAYNELPAIVEKYMAKVNEKLEQTTTYSTTTEQKMQSALS